MDRKSYNYEGNYFIIFAFHKEGDLKKAFEALFSRYIINVHILVLNNENRSEVLIYTYWPFEENKCEQINPVIWNIFKNGNLTDKKTIFPNKIKNMNGCKLEVDILDRPPFILWKIINNKLTISGIEGLLLTSLANTINFTFDYRLITEKFLLHVYKDEQMSTENTNETIANISIGGLGLRGKIYECSDATKAYIHTSLLFVYPYNDQETSFEKFFEPFQIKTWFYICIMFCLGSMLIAILKFTKRKTRNVIIGPTNTPLFDMITIFLKNPITRPATRNFARTLTIHWMFLSLIISTAYQGTLFQNLQSIDDDIPIYTIDQLVRQGFKFSMSQYSRRLFITIPEVSENLDFTNNISHYKYNYTRIMNKQAILSNKFYLNYLNHQNHHSQILSSTNLFLFPVSILLQNASCLKSEFNHQIGAYLSNGLIKYWIGDYEKAIVTISSKEPSELSVSELLGGFQICLIFYVLSIFVLSLEMLSVKFDFLRKILIWLTY